MMHFLLESELKLYQDPDAAEQEEEENWVWRWHSKFDRWFERRREDYKSALEWTLYNRGLTIAIFGLFIVVSAAIGFSDRQ
jgi:multidrug efflux pump subunit AcrB